MQPGGVEMLLDLGFPKEIFEEIDSPAVGGYAIFKDGKHITIPYSNGGDVFGQGFRYGKFVGQLRAHFSGLATATLKEGKVIGIEEVDGRTTGVRFTSAEGEQTVSADLTIVSEGGYSALRSSLSNTQREIRSYMMALLLDNCQLPYAGNGHVFISNGTPFLAYPVSSTKTRMLIDFPKDEPPKKGEKVEQYLNEVIRPSLPESMHPSFDEAVRTYPFKAMPSCEIPADPIRKPGVVLLGDSLNMRHPITGGGMTVAFTDAKLLSGLLTDADLSETAQIDDALEAFYDSRHEDSSTVNILANALYQVLSHKELSQACFDYLAKGGKKAAEPISLLGAVSRDRKLLIEHFMAVAKSGAAKKLKPIPTPKKIREAQAMVSDAIDILEPQLKNEKFGPALLNLMKVGKMVTA